MSTKVVAVTSGWQTVQYAPENASSAAWVGQVGSGLRWDSQGRDVGVGWHGIPPPGVGIMLL